jgi:hypothetical protein
MKTKYDRRRYARRPARFSVKYTVKSGTYRDLASNVSAGGVHIVTRRTIPSDQKISLQFPVFAFDSRPSVMGTVVRSGENGFAVRFDRPFERRFCPDDHFLEGDIEIDLSGKDR